MTVAEQKCAACHASANVKGHFDATKLMDLDAAGMAKVLARLESPDPTLRMPQPVPGQAATPLGVEEKRPFYTRYSQLLGSP